MHRFALDDLKKMEIKVQPRPGSASGGQNISGTPVCRANFESKGLSDPESGKGHVAMAFHDIQNDSKAMENLIASHLRFCDPSCGSYGKRRSEWKN